MVNIGSNHEISVGDTFNLIKKIMKVEAEVELDDVRLRPERSEVHRLWCDNSLINSLTGYKPEVSFESGLAQTIEWFLKTQNLSKYKAQSYNV